jgi:hypothetical protein
MPLPTLDVPTYELTLPSSGKSVRFRPFLVKEHKVLLTMAEASEDEVIRIVNEIVDVCTFNKLNVKELPHFDIEYIFLHLRAKSISEKVEVVITCAACKENYDSSFSIDELKVEKKDNHSMKIMLTNNVGIEMKYPKFDSVVKVYESDSPEEVFKLVKRSIVGIFQEDEYWQAEEQTEEDLDTFLNSLTKEQFDKIEEFFVTSPKIVQIVESDCPKCNHHNTSRIEGLQNFFV